MNTIRTEIPTTRRTTIDELLLYLQFRGIKYWMITIRNAAGVSTLKIALRGQQYDLFPEDKIAEINPRVSAESKRLYLREKLKKRVAEGYYDILYSRDIGGWQCNCIIAKYWKWKLRRIITFIRNRYTRTINENEIISIKWHFEYHWYASMNINAITWSLDHPPAPGEEFIA